MSNPVLSNTFNDEHFTGSAPMTVSGVMNKLGLMALFMAISGGAVWYRFISGDINLVNTVTTVGIFAGFILALVICFARKTAPYLVPLYAFAEGAALSGLSCIFEMQFPGIVIRAVGLTFMTIFAMYFLYAAKLIKVTEKFRSTIITMTFAVMIFYLITLVLGFFHINIPMLYDSSMLGIGLSLFVTGLAAFNLLLDFDFIENASKNFYPKEYEWIGAFGLLVTIVWLYVEVLKLLSRLQRK